MLTRHAPMVALLALFATMTPAMADSGQQALALYREGKQDQALAVAIVTLQSAPNDLAALYVGARVNQDRGQLDVAIQFAERLNRHHPALPLGWEISTQLYQAIGNLPQRDLALRQSVDTQAASMDRAMRQRRYVVRDRIAAQGRVVLVQDHPDTGGPDSVRYVFLPEGEAGAPRTYLALMTDTHTTNTWRDNSLLPVNHRLFHLSSIYVGSNGDQAQAMYFTWPDPPDYDTVRARALEIMSGTAKPLSGQPGGLALPASQPGR